MKGTLATALAFATEAVAAGGVLCSHLQVGAWCLAR